MSCFSCFNIVLTGCETQNKYRVCNSVGQQVYFAQESEYVCVCVLVCFPQRQPQRYWPSLAAPSVLRRETGTGLAVGFVFG